MQVAVFFRISWLALLAGLLLTVGCSSYQPPTRSTGNAASLSDRAEQAIARGNYRSAADLYATAADRTSGPEADSLNLKAAQNFLKAGDLALSRTRLSKINRNNTEVIAGITILEARQDLESDAPEAAIRKLGTLNSVPDRDRANYLEVQGGAQFAMGSTANAVATLIDREVWLTDPDAVLENQRLIWEGLSRQTNIEIPEDRDEIVKGWLELGQIRSGLAEAPQDLQSQLLQWGLENSEHPASSGLLVDLLGDYRRILDFPDRIALLLPLSDRLRNTGSAVRDGFFAGYFQHQSLHKKPAIKVYDVTQLGVVPAFDQARADGAEFVVGPLTKRSVDQLMRYSDGSIPVLSLNYLPPEEYPPINFFQFGLAPEDEAVQVARRVLAEGHTQGIALVPSNDWGTRLLNTFATELEAGGGTLLTYQTYNPRERDFTVPITELLHLNESRQRRRNIEGIVGQRLEFEPRRRYDAQFIFLAADAARGRLIRPQLKYNYASRLPVYATASVFQPGNKDNNELSGVNFPDMPWYLTPTMESLAMQNTVQRYWPPGSIRRGRLYAMGYDAYQLIPLLTNSAETVDTQIQGMTGTLQLVNGRVFRNLTWAQINGQGQPELLPDPVEILDETELPSELARPEEQSFLK